MKKIYLLPIAWGIIGLVFGLRFMYHSHEDHGITIRLRNTDTRYELFARYNKDLTPAISEYIDSCLQPDPLLLDHDMIESTNHQLQDGTHFYIRSEAGKLEIKVKKEENSPASIQRMKNLFEGISHLISGQ